MVGTTTDNRFSESKFIVDPSAANGAYTTITAALTAATSGTTIFIRPGTYTENITLKDGVNITAFTNDAALVILSGTVTMNTAATCTISGITIQTNAATAFSLSSANLQTLTVTNCNITATNANALTISNSNTSSVHTFTNCTFSIASTYKCFDCTGSSLLFFRNCNKGGASTTASTSTSAANIYYFQGNSNQPISISGTTALWCYGLLLDTGNVTAITSATGTVAFLFGGVFSSGTAVLFNITSTGYIAGYNATFNSTNASTTTGTGTLYDGGCVYPGIRNPTNSIYTSFNTSGTWTLIDTQVANNSANISFTKQLSSNTSFTNYVVLVSNYKPATNATALRMTFSTDGGATYLATNYSSGLNSSAYNSATLANTNSTTFCVIIPSAGNTTTSSAMIYLYDVKNGNPIKETHSTSANAGANMAYGIGSNTATNINGIRFASSSGNITTGTFSFYGVVS